MRKYIVAIILAGALGLAAVTCAVAQIDPVAVIKSDAAYKEKAEACRALVLKGGPESVPALAALLVDEKLAHMARWALEPMPCPEAGAALRDALDKTSGILKVGVINSLGIRKDAEAVPALVKLLADADAEVAQAAAVSLGMIANADALAGLQGAVAQPNLPAGNLRAFCDALMGCAEKLAAQKSDQSVVLYDQLLKVPNAPAQIKAGALRGAVLTRGSKDGLPLVVAALRGDDEDAFDAGLRVSRELGGGPEVARALVEVLPGLSPEKQIPVLGVLGECDGKTAGPAALALAKEGPVEVREVALRALGRLGYGPAIELLTQLAWGDDEALAKTARGTLSYFPGKDREASINALVENENAKARIVAIESLGNGSIEKPIPILLKMAAKDADEAVRIAALRALQDCAGIDEMGALLDDLLGARSDAEMQAAEGALVALCARQKRAAGAVVIQSAVYGSLPDGPSADVAGKVKSIVASGSLVVAASNANFGDTAPGLVKKLRVDYTQNGTPISAIVNENESLKLTVASAPDAVVDAFCAALDKAQGNAKPAMIRVLRATGSPKALGIVQATAAAEGPLKETALRTLCEWQTADALPALMELAKSSPDQTIKVLALRGAVRLLSQNTAAPETLGHYATLLSGAGSPDEKKSVLGALAGIANAGALELALGQIGDEAVRAEALQAAVAIAKTLGKTAREDAGLFNGKDLTGWTGDTAYWRVQDGAIVGGSDQKIPKNMFCWSNIPVADFYLAVDIKLEPNTGNGGVQFRSKKIDEAGQALGYQGDIGQDVWGRLYHEHGRGKLDWNDRAEKAVKPGDWNHVEILAVGPAIWTAVNGTLGVAFLDLSKDAERTGLIAAQIHGGFIETVSYKFLKLVHDPKLELAGLNAEQLIAELKPAK